LSKSLKQMATGATKKSKPESQAHKQVFKSASSANFARQHRPTLTTCQSDPGKSEGGGASASSSSANEVSAARRPTNANRRLLRTNDSFPSLAKVASGELLLNEPLTNSTETGAAFLSASNNMDDMDFYDDDDDDDDDDQTTTTTTSSCNYSTPSLMRAPPSSSGDKRKARLLADQTNSKKDTSSIYRDSESESEEDEFLNSDAENSDLNDQNNNNRNFVNGGESGHAKLTKSASTASAAHKNKLLAKQEESAKQAAQVCDISMYKSKFSTHFFFSIVLFHFINPV
jgi:hypothetical protein